jgi:hypothetical protein
VTVAKVELSRVNCQGLMSSSSAKNPQKKQCQNKTIDINYLQKHYCANDCVKPCGKLRVPIKSMKTSALIISVLWGVSSSFAQSVGNPVYEPFSDSTGTGGTSYNPGDRLAGQSQTLSSGFVSGPGNFTSTTSVQSWWSYTNAASPSIWPTIASGDLFYAGLASTGGGRSAQFGGSGASALMNLTAGTTGFLPGSGTLYYSFTLKLTGLGTLSSGGSFFAGFTKLVSYANTTTTPASVGSQLWVQSDGGTGYQLGIAMGSNTSGTGLPVAYDTTKTYNVGDTLFVVGSYSLNSGAGNDAVNLWVNPDGSSLGAGSAPASAATVANNGTVTDLARIASFTLFNNSANEPSGQIDDLRVGLDWADVTPVAVPEPSFLSLSILAGFAFAGAGVRRGKDGRSCQGMD